MRKKRNAATNNGLRQSNIVIAIIVLWNNIIQEERKNVLQIEINEAKARLSELTHKAADGESFDETPRQAESYGR